MKIKLNTLYASPLRVIQPGQVDEFSDDAAKDLIAGGYATAVGDKPAPTIETAEAKPAVETAEAPHAKKKR